MSSKRAKRAKRKEQFKNYDPEAAKPNPPAKESKKAEVGPDYVKLPGQTWVRVGSAMLLIGGLLSAFVVWYSMNAIKGLNVEDLTFLTELRGQTPILYVTMIVLTAFNAILEFAFGYVIFRNSRNPFMAKRFIIYSVIMIVINLLINAYAMTQSAGEFQAVNLAYGCAIPVSIIFGSYRNMKFAKEHPDYIPPEPTQMF